MLSLYLEQGADGGIFFVDSEGGHGGDAGENVEGDARGFGLNEENSVSYCQAS